MSDYRLKKLSAAGIPASVTDTLAKPALLKLYSQLVATGRDKLPHPTTESLPDIELKRRLDLEERKLAEQKASRAEQAEERKLKKLKLAQQAKLKKEQKN